MVKVNRWMVAPPSEKVARSSQRRMIQKFGSFHVSTVSIVLGLWIIVMNKQFKVVFGSRELTLVYIFRH